MAVASGAVGETVGLGDGEAAGVCAHVAATAGVAVDVAAMASRVGVAPIGAETAELRQPVRNKVQTTSATPQRRITDATPLMTRS